MKTVAVFFKWIRQRLVMVGRGRLWGALRSMDNEFLAKAGFVPELVQRGPGAWPWCAGSQDSGSSAGSPPDGVKIDERERPVPIDSIEQLSRMAAPESMNQDSLVARHEAA